MHMALTQAIRRASQVNRNGIATVFADRQRTWPEFQDRVARLAAGIRGLGVQDGDRVAVTLRVNSAMILRKVGVVEGDA